MSWTVSGYSDAWLCCYLLQVGGVVPEECGGGALGHRRLKFLGIE